MKPGGKAAFCVETFAAISANNINGQNIIEKLPIIAADIFPAEWGDILFIEYFKFYSFPIDAVGKVIFSCGFKSRFRLVPRIHCFGAADTSWSLVQAPSLPTPLFYMVERAPPRLFT